MHSKNEKPLKMGVIACIANLDLVDRRSVWSKIGFLHACKEKASDILKQIYANKETWEFKPYTE